MPRAGKPRAPVRPLVLAPDFLRRWMPLLGPAHAVLAIAAAAHADEHGELVASLEDLADWTGLSRRRIADLLAEDGDHKTGAPDYIVRKVRVEFAEDGRTRIGIRWSIGDFIRGKCNNCTFQLPARSEETSVNAGTSAEESAAVALSTRESPAEAPRAAPAAEEESAFSALSKAQVHELTHGDPKEESAISASSKVCLRVGSGSSSEREIGSTKIPLPGAEAPSPGSAPAEEAPSAPGPGLPLPVRPDLPVAAPSAPSEAPAAPAAVQALLLGGDAPPEPARREVKSDPLPFTVKEAVTLLEEHAAGAFKAGTGPLTRGWCIGIGGNIRAEPDRDTWRLVGRWLAAGGEGWKRASGLEVLTPAWAASTRFRAAVISAREWARKDGGGASDTARGADGLTAAERAGGLYVDGRGRKMARPIQASAGLHHDARPFELSEEEASDAYNTAFGGGGGRRR